MARKKNPRDVSFAKALFFGNILEELIFPYPEMSKEERETTTIFLESFKKYRIFL